MSCPLVSIIIPIYKRREMNFESIDCALQQDYPNVEIIVCDDCSPDGSYELICERYKNVKNMILFQNEMNLGAVGNWQVCLERAKGKYIKFLWSDDLMEASFIRKTVQILEENPDIPFVMSSIKTFTDSAESEIVMNLAEDKKKMCYKLGKIEVHRKRQVYRIGTANIYPKKVFLDGIYKKNRFMPVSPACAIFRREAVKVVGDIPNNVGFEHKITGAGPDLKMFLEALIDYSCFGFLDEPLSYFRNHAESITCSNTNIFNGYLTVKLDYLLKNNLNEYLKYMDAQIVSENLKKDIYSIQRNYQTIKKYYDTISTNGKCINGIGLIVRISIMATRVKVRNWNKLIGRIKIRRG